MCVCMCASICMYVCNYVCMYAHMPVCVCALVCCVNPTQTFEYNKKKCCFFTKMIFFISLIRPSVIIVKILIRPVNRPFGIRYCVAWSSS